MYGAQLFNGAGSFNTGRIDHLFNDPKIHDKRLFLYHGDLTDSSNLNRLLEKVQPDEIYNLGAQSHVKVSFDVPEYTAEVDAIARDVAKKLVEAQEENLSKLPPTVDSFEYSLVIGI